MKNYFVTGGSGFIGSEFIRVLLERDADAMVTNFDLLTYAGDEENNREVAESDLYSGRYKFIRGDIRNSEEVLDALPSDCAAIFNFAAESHVDRSIESAHDFVTTNVLGTQVLLDCAKAKSVKRFVQISTDEVMGSISSGEFVESAPFAPNSAYAASKAAAEHLVRAMHKTFGLDVVITRSGNNYGPRQHTEKLIPTMISRALQKKALPVYGDGSNIRDWIHVRDNCEAIWRVFEKGRSGEVYNIGARNTLSNLLVVETILGHLNRSEDLITFVPDRPGHDFRYAINPAKTESLGWKPKIPWESGIKETIDWYLEN